MTLLAEAEYNATMSAGMKLLQPDDVSHPVLVADCVRSIPEPDLLGHDFTGHEVAAVYRDSSERWVHILIASASPAVHLVIVVDQPRRSVHGHYLLDLNAVYGLEAPSAE